MPAICNAGGCGNAIEEDLNLKSGRAVTAVVASTDSREGQPARPAPRQMLVVVKWLTEATALHIFKVAERALTHTTFLGATSMSDVDFFAQEFSVISCTGDGQDQRVVVEATPSILVAPLARHVDARETIFLWLRRTERE